MASTVPFPVLHPIAPTEPDCQVCARTPAARVAFRSLVGMLVLHRLRTVRGWYCSDCGLAIFRAQTGRTLVAGWWSVTGLLGTPVVLLANVWRLHTVTRLRPGRPGYALSPAPPLDPGTPLLHRRAALGLLMFVPLALVLIAAVA